MVSFQQKACLPYSAAVEMLSGFDLSRTEKMCLPGNTMTVTAKNSVHLYNHERSLL
ncbi:hypothetical protein [Ruminococcus sp.]|uniref:hypothetical protein n=1 Tax=Ruminococcus sp. TaxID=41978 RepID=UPI0025CF65A6|nr:hypothetical protein [Ruminococcus sp.]MCR4638798.1 hypothetical protein [Ruminococcus sp.]